ncbi:MAG: hypothetical protein IT462_17295 [Planctomycetes bacterium]|nr:hypothetical protein [Planctomycetota bacterium]
MDAMTPVAPSVAPAATKAARAFPWSRTQAVLLLTRFIAASAATSGIAALAWLAPNQTPAAMFLTLAGVLAFAEIAGIALCVVEWRDYGWRALSRGAEVWPALAAACIEPVAILGALILIVYGLIASGVYTVALSRGTATGKIRGETARRLVVALANAGFIGLIAARTQGWDMKTLLGVDERTWVLACAALMLIAAARAAVDIAFWARGSE